MKLIMENWRKYLEESYDTAVVLAIFDFDATIARTVGYTMAQGPAGESVKITTQKEYDSYKDKKGWKFDFSNLKNLAFRGNDPKGAEITQITNIMKDNIGDDQIQIMVLTAREDSVKNQIQDYLSKIVGLSLDLEYIKGMAGASKGAYVYGLLEQYPNIKHVVFYDDSMNNITTVRNSLDKAIANGMIESADLFLVDGEGNPNRV